MSEISIAESKIQILYLVDRAPGVSYHLLMEKCMESLYTDFFTFSRAYEELISGNLMDKSQSGAFTGDSVVGSTENLTLTDGGRAVLKDLMSSLSASLIQHLDETAGSIIEEVSKNSGITASLEPTEDNKFRVNLACKGDGRPFSATLTVDDEETALKLCKNWKEKCSNASDELVRFITGS